MEPQACRAWGTHTARASPVSIPSSVGSVDVKPMSSSSKFATTPVSIPSSVGTEDDSWFDENTACALSFVIAPSCVGSGPVRLLKPTSSAVTSVSSPTCVGTVAVYSPVLSARLVVVLVSRPTTGRQLKPLVTWQHGVPNELPDATVHPAVTEYDRACTSDGTKPQRLFDSTANVPFNFSSCPSCVGSPWLSLFDAS